MNPLRLAATLVTACLASSPDVRAADEVVPTKSGPVNVERLAALNEPWGMEFLPDGRLLVTEKPGHLRIYADGKLSEPIGGVPKVVYRGQGGLLDVAIDPDFARNGLVYLSYAEAAETQPPNAQDVADPRFGGYFDKEDNLVKGGAVARGRLDGAQLRDVKVIWRQVPKTIGRGHFGGRLVFAPDGKLFITSGDRMRFDPAQEPGSNLGKIVRINPDGSIPTDNPFAGKSGDAGGHLVARPPQPAGRGDQSFFSAALDPRDGPSRRRRAQRPGAGQELRLARREQRRQLRQQSDPGPRDPSRVRGAPDLLVSVDLALRLHLLFGQPLPGLEGERAGGRPVVRGASSFEDRGRSRDGAGEAHAAPAHPRRARRLPTGRCG